MKRALIITYYWPPAGGGGVQRWLKFTKYMPQYGWKPFVVAPENAEYPTSDESLLKDISKETEVIKIPIWEPYKLFKILTGKKKEEKVNTGFLFDDKKKGFVEKLSLWLRGNLLIPDPRVFWVKPVVKKLLKEIETIQPDVIITTGPPHSVHLIGGELQKRTNVKWVADFRDPWSTIDYLDFFNLTDWAKKRQRRLEKRVLHNADLVLAVSENWKQELIQLGGRNVEVITNGYDQSDFVEYRKARTEKFIFTYTGLITSLRNPVFLWDLLEEMLQANKSFADRFELQLIGTIDIQVLNGIKQKSILSQKLNYLGYLSHEEVLKAYAESSMLLLLLNQSDNAAGHIPGKLFEYMASQTPVLALGEKSGDVGRILTETSAGRIFGIEDEMQIKEYILSANGEIGGENAAYQQYSRSSLTKKLIKSLQLI